MPTTFPSVIDASSLNGITGFRVSGYMELNTMDFQLTMREISMQTRFPI